MTSISCLLDKFEAVWKTAPAADVVMRHHPVWIQEIQSIDPKDTDWGLLIEGAMKRGDPIIFEAVMSHCESSPISIQPFLWVKKAFLQIRFGLFADLPASFKEYHDMKAFLSGVELEKRGEKVKAFQMPQASGYPYLEMLFAMNMLSLDQKIDILDKLLHAFRHNYDLKYAPDWRYIDDAARTNNFYRQDNQKILLFWFEEFKKLPLQNQLYFLKNRSDQLIDMGVFSSAKLNVGDRHVFEKLHRHCVLEVLKNANQLSQQDKHMIGSLLVKDVFHEIQTSSVLPFTQWDGVPSLSSSLKYLRNYLHEVHRLIPIKDYIAHRYQESFFRSLIGLGYWDLSLDWLDLLGSEITKKHISKVPPVIQSWDGLCLNSMSVVCANETHSSAADFFVRLMDERPDLMTWIVPLHHYLRLKKKTCFKHGGLDDDSGLRQVRDWFEQPIFYGLKRFLSERGEGRGTDAETFAKTLSDDRPSVKWIGHVLLTRLHLHLQWKKTEAIWQAEQQDTEAVKEVEKSVAPSPPRRRL